jgi:Ca2+-binding RTX toxin-like protein
MAQNENDVRRNTIALWLDAAIRQVAAESYLHGIGLTSEVGLTQRLTRGNTPLESTESQYVRLTQSQTASFLTQYEVIDHHANDASGFSATLLRRIVADPITGAQAGEYTLAFRSTEYKNPSQGGDFDRDGFVVNGTSRADGEIAFNGFATAQISAMEAYYERLKVGITSTDPGNSSQLNTAGNVNAAVRDFFSSPANTFQVVGYSLGAHLATVFTERHASIVGNTYVFNAPGRGTLGRTVAGLELSRYEEMFSYFKSVLLNPDAAFPLGKVDRDGAKLYIKAKRMRESGVPWSPFELTPANLALDNSRRNLYPDVRYAWALYATKQQYALDQPGTSADGDDITVNFGAFSKITQLFGHANFGDKEATANSGVHAPTTSIFIEAQPFIEQLSGVFGVPGDFGNTHSLTLIIDSLALMEAFMTADGNLTKRQVETIFSGASNQSARKLSLLKNDTNAEGISLEVGLDALRKLYGAQGVRFAVVGGAEQEFRFDAGVSEWTTPVDRRNGGFGDAANRRIFHRHIELLKEKIAEKGGATIKSLVPESQFLADNGEPIAGATALAAGFIANEAKKQTAEGFAYRYALRELNPFVVTGNDALYPTSLQNELSYYDSSTGEGELSQQWIEDRAKLLAHQLTFGVNNKLFDRSLDLVNSELFEDQATRSRVSFFTNLQHSSASTLMDQQDQTMLDRYFATVDYDKRTLFGKDDASKKYEDNLVGARSVDRLYGGQGNDHIDGKAGGDFLDGGVGKDQLLGGAGDDELLGGKDTDVLRGGEGSDTYIWRRGDGFDTIIDFAGDGFGGDGLGKIEFLNADLSGDKQLWDPATNDKLFQDANYFYVFTGESGTRGTLTIVKKDEISTFGGIHIEGFKSGDLGISLVGSPTFTKTDQSGTSGNDEVTVADAFRRFFGLAGNDRIVVSLAQAEGWGGTGDDYVSNDEGDQTLRGEEGRDILLASGGADSLFGGTGNDALQGGEDDDLLDGGDGNDVLDGGLGSDVLNGGAGDDFLAGGGSLVVAAPWSATAVPEFGAFLVAGQPTGLIGMSGAVALDADAGDVLDGGAGKDTIFAGSGEDFAEGGEGDDLISGDAGSDTLSGGAGADSLYGDPTQGSITIGGQDFYTLPEFHGNDTLLGGLGDDTLQGDGGADELYGGEDNDILIGDAAGLDESFHGADYLDGGDGNDVLLGQGKDDTLFGGAGDDNLGGDSSSIADALHGDDYLDGEDGADILHGDGGDDTLFGGAGDDILDGDASNVAFEFHGDDYIEGGEGNDALQGSGGSDTLFGGAGNDSLAGDVAGIPVEFAGDDYLDGEAGNDILDGGAGNDTLTGGAGVDTLMGGAGDDLYLVNLGSQNDFIQDVEGANTVRMGAPVSFVFQNLGSDGRAYLGLRYSSSDIVHIQEGLTNSSIRTELSDGTVRTAADWRASFTQFSTVLGGSGADTLSGTALAESFAPGGGNDVIVFERGSGFDRVSSFGQVTGGAQGLDKIQLGSGVAASDLLVQNDGDDEMFGGAGDDSVYEYVDYVTRFVDVIPVPHVNSVERREIR